jgi:hypothetical protein
MVDHWAMSRVAQKGMMRDLQMATWMAVRSVLLWVFCLADHSVDLMAVQKVGLKADGWVVQKDVQMAVQTVHLRAV